MVYTRTAAPSKLSHLPWYELINLFSGSSST
jgi:hypothetical protein